MKEYLNLHQAYELKSLINNNKFKPNSNFETVCALVLCFADMLLDNIIVEIKNK